MLLATIDIGTTAARLRAVDTTRTRDLAGWEALRVESMGFRP
jgi:hypothetical protein